MSTLLKQLIQRDCLINVVRGELQVSHCQDKRYNAQWHGKHRMKLLREISNLLSSPTLVYESHSTGSYDKGTKPGLRLQFFDISTGELPYAIFNVSLKRVRKSKAGKAGGALPKGRFSVSDRSMFYRFWLNTNLELPRSSSEFYKCMGKLKSILFTGQTNQANKIINKTLVPVELAHRQILKLVGGNCGISLRQASDKEVVSAGGNDVRQEEVVNSCDKKIPESQAEYGLDDNWKYVTDKVSVKNTTDNITTCPPKYEIRLQEEAYKDSSLSPYRKKPEEQTDEEWWGDYDEAG